MSTEQPISGGWYVAFFVIGILLGLLALHLLGGGDPLEPLLSKRTDKQASDPSSHKPAMPHTVTHPRQVQAVPAKSDGSSEAVSERAEEKLPQPQSEPISCDHESASAVREKARELAEITDYSDHLAVKMRGEWAYYSDNVRRSFVAKFAESDACLNGKSRPIEFFYQGKRFAYADPDKGVSFD